jgi:hypothetical protein
LQYVIQFEGTEEECLIREREKIYHYALLPENLARKIPLIRPPGNKMIIEMTALREFDFTSAAWHEVNHQLKYVRIRNLINEKLRLSDYGQGIDRQVFMYLALLPSSQMPTKELYRFVKKTKTVELSLKLDYNRLFAASQSEAMQMMCELYADSILRYYPRFKIPDFDYRAFYQDVKLLFIEQNWLPADYASELEKEFADRA